jgi:FkbM family methyltransferase
MKKIIKFLLLSPVAVTRTYLHLLGKVRPQWSLALNDEIYGDSIARTSSVRHVSAGEGSEVNLRIHSPNAVCRFRAQTFSTKEPETLEWIEKWGGEGAFFDVGANIGLYSLYFAKLFHNQVYAFEPSALNLGLLAKNIALNKLSEQIVVMPIPLTSENMVASLTMSDTNEGGALSTFGATFGHDGLPLVEKMSYQMPGCSLDFLVESGVVPELPSLLKIDVDGIEHLVLEGAHDVLRSPTLRSVLIEVDEEFRELASEVSRHLLGAGFSLEAKRHSEMFETGKFSSSFNQIWVRN